MKRALAIALSLLLAAPVRAESVMIPFEEGYPPFSAVGEDGQPNGFNIDVAREIAARLGLEAEFVPTDFDAIQFGSWPEDWSFAVSSMSQSVERMQHFAFIGPYYFDQVVIVTSDALNLGFDRAAFTGHSFGVCQGCIYGDYLTGEGGLFIDGAPSERPLGDVTVRIYPSDFDVLRALGEAAAPEVDYGLTSLFHALYYESIGFPVRHDPVPLFVEPLWIVVPKESEEEVAAVQGAFDALRDSGRLSELSVRHLGADFTVLPN